MLSRCISSRLVTIFTRFNGNIRRSYVGQMVRSHKLQDVIKPERAELVVERTLPDGRPKPTYKILEDAQQLLQYRSIEESLAFVAKHPDLMMTEHVYRCFANIHRELLSIGFEGNAIEHVRGDERFHQLCLLAGKKAPHFGASHVAYMVKFLVKLHYTSSNMLLRVFLQLAKHHVNEMNIVQNSYLGHYLTQLEETDQIAVLKRALAISVQNNLRDEVRYLDTHTFVNILEAYGGLLDADTMNFLIIQLILRKDSTKFNKPDVILKSLARYNYRDTQLITVCEHLAADFLARDQFSADQAYDVVSALHEMKWYSSDVFHQVVGFIERKTPPLTMIIMFMEKMIECSYFPTALVVKYVSKLNRKDIEQLTESTKISLISILRDARGIVDHLNSNIYLSELVDDSVNVVDYNTSRTVAIQNYEVLHRNLEMLRVGSVCHGTPNYNIPQKYFTISSNGEDVVTVIVYENSEVFLNLGKLKGRYQLDTSKFVNPFILSYWKYRHLPDHEKFNLLQTKVEEARQFGRSELL